MIITLTKNSPARLAELTAAVDAERGRRAAVGFLFGGALYQAREQDKINILGVSSSATIAILNGAQAGDLRWSDPDVDFTFIAADNSAPTMDAPTTVSFGQAAMAFINALVKAGRAIKDDILAGRPPADIARDPRWPS